MFALILQNKIFELEHLLCSICYLSVQVHIYHVDLNNLLIILQCVALFKINCRYTFRCRPTTKDGTAHFVSVNDIVFNPL